MVHPIAKHALLCLELENHLGLNNKDLAEFIIHLARNAKSEGAFKKDLLENGAEMTDVFIERLWTLIQHMTVSPTYIQASLTKAVCLERSF